MASDSDDDWDEAATEWDDADDELFVDEDDDDEYDPDDEDEFDDDFDDEG